MVTVVLCRYFSFFLLARIFSREIDYLAFSFPCKGPVAVDSMYSILGLTQSGSSLRAAGVLHVRLPLPSLMARHASRRKKTQRGNRWGTTAGSSPTPPASLLARGYASSRRARFVGWGEPVTDSPEVAAVVSVISREPFHMPSCGLLSLLPAW